MCLDCCRTRRVGAMKKLMSPLAGLAVLVALIAGCILGVRWVGNWFLNIDQDRRLAIVALSGIVLAPIISYVTTRAIETRKLAGQAAIERKIELYENFVDLMVDMTGMRANRKATGDELLLRMQELTPKTLIYGSNRFIKEWRKMSRVSAQAAVGSATERQLMDQIENVFKAIRKDVGHNRWSPQRGDIVSVITYDAGDVVE